ncbi:hypothetical protein [Novosphingobium percolationis]|uniref:hypothetical protein n=1 Tax=Novosphingobium percolationis TaxID=2871811 RepID=UPI001CD225FC|nr:hypothetical protein [Novosphingobium percolationis]MCH7627497.1 hypothetical protein [Pseudomonadota bacterium]
MATLLSSSRDFGNIASSSMRWRFARGDVSRLQIEPLALLVIGAHGVADVRWARVGQFPAGAAPARRLAAQPFFRPYHDALTTTRAGSA